MFLLFAARSVIVNGARGRKQKPKKKGEKISNHFLVPIHLWASNYTQCEPARPYTMITSIQTWSLFASFIQPSSPSKGKINHLNSAFVVFLLPESFFSRFISCACCAPTCQPVGTSSDACVWFLIIKTLFGEGIIPRGWKGCDNDTTIYSREIFTTLSRMNTCIPLPIGESLQKHCVKGFSTFNPQPNSVFRLYSHTAAHSTLTCCSTSRILRMSEQAALWKLTAAEEKGENRLD